jgi:hypothetical protein
MTSKEEYIHLYHRMAELCEEQGWGDPFSYARSKEIYAAIRLGHEVSETLSGADAYTEDGRPLEYKSTIGKNCQGNYTGISVKETWEEQKDYLINEKICKYPEHYYNRFHKGRLEESWKMSGQQVFDVLLPKLEKNYHKDRGADPRLAATVTWRDIQKHGEPVI